jgi:hypothetical protein
VNDVSGTHAELFSTCSYDCVRHFISPLMPSPISLHLESRRL